MNPGRKNLPRAAAEPCEPRLSGAAACRAFPVECRVHTPGGVCGIGTLSKRFKAEHTGAPQWPF